MKTSGDRLHSFLWEKIKNHWKNKIIFSTGKWWKTVSFFLIAEEMYLLLHSAFVLGKFHRPWVKIDCCEKSWTNNVCTRKEICKILTSFRRDIVSLYLTRLFCVIDTFFVLRCSTSDCDRWSSTPTLSIDNSSKSILFLFQLQIVHTGYI